MLQLCSPPRAALVTGAARRIGRAIALRLARDGFALALHANRSWEEAEALADEIRAGGGQACVVIGDLADAQAVAGLIPAATEALGPIGVLVNNASMFERDGPGQLDASLWDRQFAVNLRAPVFLAEALATHLPQHATGVVVNLIDQRVLKLTPEFTSYTLTKAALHTATRTLAQALAPRVRVVGVGPGPTLANERQSAADFLKQSGAVPLGSGPAPEEIADTVSFLIGARSVTGQMIAVDGGQHLAWETPDVVGIVE